MEMESRGMETGQEGSGNRARMRLKWGKGEQKWDEEEAENWVMNGAEVG